MASTTPPEPKSEQEVLSTYRQMQQEMQGLIQNLTKIEMERNEHRCVGFCCCVGRWRIAVSKLGRQGTGEIGWLKMGWSRQLWWRCEEASRWGRIAIIVSSAQTDHCSCFLLSAMYWTMCTYL